MKNLVKFSKFAFVKTWKFPREVDQFLDYTFMRLRIDPKSICHTPCGESNIGGLRIDIDPNVKPDLVADILELPKILGLNSQKVVLSDLPWQISYPERRKFCYALRDITQIGGTLIINAPWSPWVQGLSDYESDETEIWKVIQTFNSYRDLVDFWIFKKEFQPNGNQ